MVVTGNHSNTGIYMIKKLPYIYDKNFEWKTYLMRPFSRSAILHDERKEQFNKRKCRSQCVVENVFGILTQK